MKNLLTTIAFTIATILTIRANAQQYTDYVITVKGDSIPCNISTPLIGNIKYEGGGMTKPEKIKPDAIKEYYIASKKSLSRSVFKEGTSKPMFMTVVEKGKISLYEMINTNYMYGGGSTTTVTWYVGKGSDYVTDFKSSGLFFAKSRKQRKDNFGEMLKDNQAVYDKYKTEDKFSFKQIQNLVHLYNTGQPLGI